MGAAPRPRPPTPGPPKPPEPEGDSHQLHGGRVIGRILKEHQIEYVFGIPAAFVWALEVGFHEHGIKRIQMRHQQGAAYAADAYARCTRSPGVCFGNAGVGMTDSVSGINQAWLGRSPLIGLFGMHEWDQSRRGGLQEVYPSRICETMTKWSVETHTACSGPDLRRGKAVWGCAQRGYGIALSVTGRPCCCGESG
jgi:acetolactate synthase-1/2/3 large subunit